MNASIFRQPRAVWAVAFACVVAFMGIGLVDPILPVIAKDLDAGPSQVSLLFTSYFAVTGVSMLVTGFVSSRIGPRRTLLAGLALVVLCSAMAGLSDSIGGIVGWRAGWGLGNALFIATALSVIVGAASGGVAGAIIFYEAALGLGIASGPLLGGLLGGISWRGPFFGTAVLMAVGFVAITALLERTPAPPRRIGLREPLAALRHPGLRTAALVAVAYNFGFFTLLAYTPFPLGLGAHALGLIFFGWGLLLALTSVFVAPRLEHRLGLVPTLAACFALIAADLALMAAGVDTRAVLIAGVVVAGAFLGIVNTVLTTLVMQVAPVERPVASAAYSFVRFTGGALAPWIAGKLAEHVGAGTPFVVGAAAVTLAVVILLLGRRLLVPHAAPAAAPTPAVPPAPALAAAPAPILLAVGPGPDAEAVTAAALRAARARRTRVEVVHVRETEVTPEGDARELETAVDAQEALRGHVERLTAAGVEARGEVLEAVGGHEDAARAVLERAGRAGAGLLIVGAPTRHGGLWGRSLAVAAIEDAPCSVLVVQPAAEPAAALAAA